VDVVLHDVDEVPELHVDVCVENRLSRLKLISI